LYPFRRHPCPIILDRLCLFQNQRAPRTFTRAARSMPNTIEFSIFNYQFSMAFQDFTLLKPSQRQARLVKSSHPSAHSLIH
jgi:hypothetical protein